MTALYLDTGKCPNGHQFGPYTLIRTLGPDGRPKELWAAECMAPVEEPWGRTGIVIHCNSHVYLDADEDAPAVNVTVNIPSGDPAELAREIHRAVMRERFGGGRTAA